MAENIISIDWTLIIQIINFLAFFILADRFLFKPVLRLMDERNNELNVHTAEADSIRSKANGLLEEFEKALAEAKAKSKEILSQALLEAEAERQKILEEANMDAAAKVEKAKAEIWKSFELEKAKLEKESDKIADEIVRKLLSKAA